MSDYKINEKDVEAVLRHLRVKDPENANRGYAIQKLLAMNELAKELVNEDLEFSELLAKAMDKEVSNPGANVHNASNNDSGGVTSG